MLFFCLLELKGARLKAGATKGKRFIAPASTLFLFPSLGGQNWLQAGQHPPEDEPARKDCWEAQPFYLSFSTHSPIVPTIVDFLPKTHSPFYLSNLPCLSKGQAAQSPIVMLLHVSNKHHCKFYLLMSTVIKLKRHGTNHQKTWVWTLLLLLCRFSHVQPCEIPQTAAHRAPLSLGFFKQEHWSGLPFPSPVHESESESEVAQSCPTLSNPKHCSPPGSSIHGIFQARVLEWVFIAFSMNLNIC